MVRAMVRKMPAARRMPGCSCLVGACLAAPPGHAAAGKLPALHRWYFSHPIDTLQVTSARDLASLFTAKNYSLPRARPSGRRSRGSTCSGSSTACVRCSRYPRARALFIRIVLPLIARANAEIRAQRALLDRSSPRRRKAPAIVKGPNRPGSTRSQNSMPATRTILRRCAIASTKCRPRSPSPRRSTRAAGAPRRSRCRRMICSASMRRSSSTAAMFACPERLSMSPPSPRCSTACWPI